MPDANGQIKGTGWSRAAEAAFDRLARAKWEDEGGKTPADDFADAVTAAELDDARQDWLHNHVGEPFPPELRFISRTELPNPVE
jgi:hypothetical protein